MGEEKKEEVKKMEEKKPEEGGEEKKKADEKEDNKKAEAEDSKGDESAKEQPPPPPQEIVLKVYMHCDGCAKKVRRCLRGFDGVEDVITDCKSHKVVVKGEKADPLKVLERVQRKSHRRVELLSPIPKPPEAEDKPKEEDKPKPEEKKQEPKVITVVMKVHMHCEACAQEIKKRILRMKGVESAEPDLKSSQVTVKGTFEAAKLIEYVYKRTGKHAVIVKQEPEPEKKEEDKPKDGGDAKEEKKDGQENGDKDKKKEGSEEENKDKKEEGNNNNEQIKGAAAAEGGTGEDETKMVEIKKNEYNYYPPRYAMEMYAYPPQIFSDENPNACSVM